MATTTTNLGLTKPAYTDSADIGVINTNMDLIDTAVGNINQSTLRDVPFAVAVSAWSGSSGNFTANFTSAYITSSSKEIMTFDSSLASYAKAHINVAKKSGGGGLTFTTATKPTGTITGNAYVFDNDDKKLPTLIEGTVTPIANGGTGQSSLAGAQQVLGITELNSNIATFIDVKGSTTAISLSNMNMKANTSTKIVSINGSISGLTLSAGYTIFSNFLASGGLPLGDSAISAFSASFTVQAYVSSSGSLVIYTPSAQSNATVILGGSFVRA